MKYSRLTFLLVFVLASFLAAQTAPTAKIKTEPVSSETLTNLGLTTNSVSAGLPVFANQTYVYLSANDVGNYQPVLTSNFNLFQKPAGSNAVLEDLGVANWKGLKADVKGAYKIELTITTANGTDQDTLTVFSGDYVGVGNFDGVTASFPSCMSCHTGQTKFDGIYATWKETGHANTLKKAMDTWSFFSPSCLKCHSTGTDYDLVAANNGFDDVAASLGWVWVGPPAAGKWDAFKSAYPGAVKFATIGCENCHGAGSNHPGSQAGSQFTTNATFEAGVCAQCHAESQGVQYESSLHSEAIWSNSFAQGTASQNNNLQNCIRCHDAKGYINFTSGTTTNTTGMTRAMHVSITCQTCHDPHGNTNDYNLRNSPASSDTLGNGFAYTLGGNGKLCMDCHKARRDNVVYQNTNISSTWGPHHSVQTDNYFGKNAYEFSGPYQTNMHQNLIADACATCHMTVLPDTSVTNANKVGAHTFRLRNSDTGYEHLGGCTGCHGPKSSFDDFMASNDYDGDGTVESIPSEVQGALRNIRILLPPAGQDTIIWTEIRASADSVLFKKAYWNYQLIAYDGSNGMHNSKFAFDVLTQTQNALGFVSVEEEPSATVYSYSLSQNYPNPFNPATVINFSLPAQSNVKVIVYDALGNQIDVIADGVKSAGSHSIKWNAGNNASGIYFYKLEADNFVQVRKMILMK
jgi:hypothetical protein